MSLFSTPPEPPDLPDYVALLEWLNLCIAHLQERIEQHQSDDELRQRLEVEIAKARVFLSALSGKEDVTDPEGRLQAVRESLVAGLMTWKTKERPTIDKIPPQLIVTLAADIFWPLITTPSHKLPLSWYKALETIVGSPLWRLVWDYHCRYNLRKFASNKAAFGEFFSVLSEPIYESGLLELFMDLGDPKRGGAEVADRAGALAGRRPGIRLVTIIYTALTGAAGMAIGGLIGNRFDAIVMDVWQKFVDQSEEHTDEVINSRGEGASVESRIYEAFAKADYDLTIIECTRALENNSSNVFALKYRAEAYRVKGNYIQAITDASAALDIDSKSTFAYQTRGAAYRQKGNYDQAIADCTQTLRLDPSSAFAFAERGAAYLMKGNYDLTIADTSAALEINPKSALAYQTRGAAYRQKGSYDQAIADCTQALRLNPSSAFAFAERGETYRQKGNYNQAISDASRAIELNPKSTLAYDTRGEIYRMKGKLNQAIADCTQALKLDPSRASALETRGAAFFAKQDYARAMSDLLQALRINPHSTFARDFIKRIKNMRNRR